MKNKYLIFMFIVLVLFSFSVTFAHWADNVINDYYDSGTIPHSIVYNDPNSFVSKGDASAVINLFYSFQKDFESVFHSFDVAKDYGYFQNSAIDDYITREEFAPIICKLSSYDVDYDAVTSFEDDEMISNWAKPYVQRLYKEGVLEGYPDNSFKPNKNLSFGELVIALSRINGTRW